MRLLLFLTAAVCPMVVNAQRHCIKCAPVVKEVITPVVVEEQPAQQIFILNQVPAIPQGQTVYESTAYPQLGLIDIDRVIAQAMALRASAIESEQLLHSEAFDLVEAAIKAEMPVRQTLAKGLAAAQVLDELDLDQPAESEDFTAQSATPLIAKHCQKCHRGPKADGGFRLDQEFDAGRAIAQIVSQEMPKGGKLEPVEQLAVIGEFLKNVSPKSKE